LHHLTTRDRSKRPDKILIAARITPKEDASMVTCEEKKQISLDYFESNAKSGGY
jgi:hypothetical protein